jgi:hypothetical protein
MYALDSSVGIALAQFERRLSSTWNATTETLLDELRSAVASGSVQRRHHTVRDIVCFTGCFYCCDKSIIIFYSVFNFASKIFEKGGCGRASTAPPTTEQQVIQ